MPSKISDQVWERWVVRKIARKLEITGFVENMELYDVRIVAEGEEDALNEFATQIRIENHPVFPVSVEEVEVEFGTATGEFEYFEIKRGEWYEEFGEKIDTVVGALLYRYEDPGKESVQHHVM